MVGPTRRHRPDHFEYQLRRQNSWASDASESRCCDRLNALSRCEQISYCLVGGLMESTQTWSRAMTEAWDDERPPGPGWQRDRLGRWQPPTTGRRGTAHSAGPPPPGSAHGVRRPGSSRGGNRSGPPPPSPSPPPPPSPSRQRAEYGPTSTSGIWPTRWWPNPLTSTPRPFHMPRMPVEGWAYVFLLPFAISWACWAWFWHRYRRWPAWVQVALAVGFAILVAVTPTADETSSGELYLPAITAATAEASRILR